MSTVGTLNDLLARNYDAEKGFNAAAEKAQNPLLEGYFKKNAQMHNKFGHELKTEISTLGGEPDKGSSFLGDAHRAWLNIKSTVAGDTDEALLEECTRGQSKAKSDYKDAMQNLDNPTVVGKLAKHEIEIDDIVAELKTLDKIA